MSEVVPFTPPAHPVRLLAKSLGTLARYATLELLTQRLRSLRTRRSLQRKTGADTSLKTARITPVILHNDPSFASVSDMQQPVLPHVHA